MNRPLFYTREERKTAFWLGFALGVISTFIALAVIGLWLP